MATNSDGEAGMRYVENLARIMMDHGIRAADLVRHVWPNASAQERRSKNASISRYLAGLSLPRSDIKHAIASALGLSVPDMSRLACPEPLFASAMGNGGSIPVPRVLARVYASEAIALALKTAPAGSATRIGQILTGTNVLALYEPHIADMPVPALALGIRDSAFVNRGALLPALANSVAAVLGIPASRLFTANAKRASDHVRHAVPLCELSVEASKRPNGMVRLDLDLALKFEGVIHLPVAEAKALLLALKTVRATVTAQPTKQAEPA